MRLRNVILAIVVTITVPVALIAGYARFIIDLQSPRPLCHRQLTNGLSYWLEKEQATIAPNMNGRSDESFAAFAEELGDEEDKRWPAQYRYVPGLQKDDPGDLVLAYFVQPTRFIHHGSVPTIFDKKKWIIIPLDFADEGHSPFTPGQPARSIETKGECSENISLAEFRQRLKMTLDYLRDNDRPHWQTVVEEHTKFLDSIPEN